MCSQKVLLLNASNMEKFPVFPYAFIQVPAVARREGIEVICKDLLGIPLESWEQTVRNLIELNDPAMIFITLRNTDSMVATDYDGDGSGNAYFPIERTKELIAAIRSVSELKIVLGGFGFSLLPDEIMRYLRPDLGVFGGPDAIFEKFEDIQAGNYADIANLIYFQENQLLPNSRKFFPPLASIEYTPQVIDEMKVFYSTFPTPGFQGAPVEVIRGCSHSCFFCAEPHVAGGKVRYRDLSAAMCDIEMLVDYGITKIYMISSELNPEGNTFVLQLANLILAFNARQTEDRRVKWFGSNFLLNFTLTEYEKLYASGFTGGWFDVTALDDENARAMRTPYRNKTLLVHLKTFAHFERKRLGLLRAKEAGQSEMEDIEVNATPGESTIKWSLFLGNPSTTSKTIRNTLQLANREGLAQLFESCSIIKILRVFNYENPNNEIFAATYSVTPNLERIAYTQMLPSFANSPGLLREFNTEEEIIVMFDHIAETYLSTKYRTTRDWSSFVRRHTTAHLVTSWIAELTDINGVRLPTHIGENFDGEQSAALKELFSETSQDEEGQISEDQAKQVVDTLLSGCLQAFPEIYRSMGIPTRKEGLERVTPYELAVAIFNRWRIEEELVDEMTMQSNLVMNGSTRNFIRFCIRAILYTFNVQIKAKYRDLFIA